MESTTEAPRATAASPEPMLPQPFRVRAVRPELDGVFTLDLDALDRETDFRFAPGQFNMLYQFGVGEVPISMSGDPAKHHTLTHTIRAVGAVTDALQRLSEGSLVGVRGPFGTSWPTVAAEGADVVVLAGGIGLAPLRPLVYHILANRSRFGSVCIFYGARTPDEILFRDELAEWRGRFDLNVEVTVDRAGPDWLGKVGVVTKLLAKKGFSPTESVACLCGPEVMMRYAVMSLNELGVENDRIHVSMERNMKCAVGFCGHCQWGTAFVCRDGPVFRFDTVEDRFNLWEL
jgi:NAD(P)H-flavin reductase